MAPTGPVTRYRRWRRRRLTHAPRPWIDGASALGILLLLLGALLVAIYVARLH